MKTPLVGDLVRAFDAAAWQEYGQDLADNTVFWRLGEVVRVYQRAGDTLADLRWLGSKHESMGHFVDGLSPVKRTSSPSAQS